MRRPILWFDFETGGLDPQVHSPLSFAMIGTSSDGVVLGSWYTHLRFEPMVVSAGALAVNKIDLRESGLSADQFKDQFHARMKDWFFKDARPNRNNMPLMGGHNVSFDKPFLERWAGTGEKGDWTGCLNYQLDTLTLAVVAREFGYIECENLRLGTIAAYLGLTPEGELHNALTDLKLTIAVYEKLKEIMKK